MLERARSDRNVNIILVHDLSRFGRDSGLAKMQLDELRRFGVRVISLNDPEFDPETVAGVYMNAITLAKNRSLQSRGRFPYSKRVQVQRSDSGP